MNRTGIIVCTLMVGCALSAAVAGDAVAVDQQSPGSKFFHEQVLPRLAENGCPSCHAVGYLHPNVIIYEQLLRRLAIGDSEINNVVIQRIANLSSIAPDRPNHPGGQRCVNVDAEPCKTIRRWWNIEFGPESKR